MSQGSKKAFEKLYLSVAYAAALRLCPSVLRKTNAVGSWLKNSACFKAKPSPDINCMDASAEMQGACVKIKKNGRFTRPSVSIIGRMFGVLPSGVQCAPGEFFLIAPNECAAELDMKCKKCSSVGCVICAGRRIIERPRKTGFDLLRVTFNLARGNIEDQVFAASPV